jgi:hypothetical protein
MKDIEIAKQLLEEQGSALVIVKDGNLIFESKEKGIKPLYTAFITLGQDLEGASVVDRVTGRAAAMICVGANIGVLHTKLLSERAIQVLDQSMVEYTYDKLTPYIKNRNQTDTCPVEKLSQGITDIQVLIEKIKGFLSSVSN